MGSEMCIRDRFMGIDGVMYAGPVADCLAAVVVAVMVIKELRRDIYNCV